MGEWCGGVGDCCVGVEYGGKVGMRWYPIYQLYVCVGIRENNFVTSSKISFAFLGDRKCEKLMMQYSASPSILFKFSLDSL